MSLVLGYVPYKVTYIEAKDDGRIQFYLARFNIKSSLLVNSDDDLTVDA